MKTSIALRVSVLAAIAAVSSVHAQEATFAKRIPAEATGEVQINNVAGTIRVKTWDRPEIDIQARLHGSIEKVDVVQQAGRNVIEVVYPRLSSGRRSADLEVSIPAGSRLEVSAVSASIDVTGNKGAT